MTLVIITLDCEFLFRAPLGGTCHIGLPFSRPSSHKGPQIHINTRIPHSGPKAQDEGHSRSRGLQDPHVHVVFWAP